MGQGGRKTKNLSCWKDIDFPLPSSQRQRKKYFTLRPLRLCGAFVIQLPQFIEQIHKKLTPGGKKLKKLNNKECLNCFTL